MAVDALYKNLAQVQMSRSKVKVTRDKQRAQCCQHPLGVYEWYVLAANSVQQQQTGPCRVC